MSNIKHNIKKAALRGSSFKTNINIPNISIISGLYNKNKYQSIVEDNITYIPFLDLYTGASVAYSVFKLRSAYSGSCVRVLRSSDLTETDIGFVSNYLDTASLLTFVGASNGSIVKWYDQSGNGNDLIQSVSASQPRIVNAGALNSVNSRASLLFDGINDFFDLTSLIDPANLFSSLSVMKRSVGGTIGVALQNYTVTGGSCYTPFAFSTDKIFIRSDNGFNIINGTDATANQQLLSGTVNGATKVIYKNNISQASTFTASATTGNFEGMGKFNITVFGLGNIQEMILYQSDQTANLSAMNINRMAAFGIV